jgi:signal transduction histidine kinase
MTNSMPRSWMSVAAQRWPFVVTGLPYLLLGFCAALTVAIKGPASGSLRIDLALTALTAAWMLVMFTLRPSWRNQPRMMAVFITGLIVLMAVLVVRDPWYGFFTPAGYLYAFRLFPWPWLLLPGTAVAALAGTAQSYGVDKTTPFGVLLWLAVVAMNVLVICGSAWVTWKGEQQSEQRDQALAQVREANRKLEATLAENAGLHEQLLTQAREAGVLDERQRMAREIHDTLAQGLAGIITQLQAAEQAQVPAEWRRHVIAATRLARDSLTEARRSVDALRPEPLETARLADALAAVAERWSALHGIAVQVTTTGTAAPMPADAESALLRAAQEALANVAKHAQASRVGLTLSYMEHEVALDVRDDGRGFDRRECPDGRRGFGLTAMRQRIEGLRGTLQVESEPGAGTAISACVPTRTGATV